MNQQPNDDLSSRHVKAGPERAPHRAFYYAMGLTEELLTQLPNTAEVAKSQRAEAMILLAAADMLQETWTQTEAVRLLAELHATAFPAESLPGGAIPTYLDQGLR